MSIRRTVGRTVAGLAMGAAAVAGVAVGAGGTAWASEGDGVIQSGEFIVYRDCNFSGPGFDFATVHYDYYNVYYINSTQLVDNSISSGWNTSTVNSVNAFFNPGFTGPRFVFLPGARANVCGDFNDQISSHTF